MVTRKLLQPRVPETPQPDPSNQLDHRHAEQDRADCTHDSEVATNRAGGRAPSTMPRRPPTRRATAGWRLGPKKDGISRDRSVAAAAVGEVLWDMR